MLLPIGESPGSLLRRCVHLEPEPAVPVHRRRDGVRAGWPPATSPAARTSSWPGLPPAVDSSTLTSYEIGLKSQFADRRVLFDVTGFYIDWSDIQVASVVNGICGLVNAGEASSKGLELSTAFRVDRQLVAGPQRGLHRCQAGRGLSAHLDSRGAGPGTLVEITSGLAGDVLPYVPEWSWTATGDYYFPLDNGWTGPFRRCAALGRRSEQRHDQRRRRSSTTPPCRRRSLADDRHAAAGPRQLLGARPERRLRQ